MPIAVLERPDRIEFELVEIRDYKHRNALFTRSESGYSESLSGFPRIKTAGNNAPGLGDIGGIVLAQNDEMLSSFLQLCEKRNAKSLYDYKNTFPVAVFKDYAKRFLRGWLGEQVWHFFGYNVAFIEKNYVILFVIQFNVLQYYNLLYLSDKAKPVTAPPHKVDYIVTNFKITNETSKILLERKKNLDQYVRKIENMVESESNLSSLQELDPVPGMHFYTINLCEILDDPIAFANFKPDADLYAPGGFYHSLYNNRLRTEQWYHELISAIRDSVTISLQDLENEISADLMYFAHKVLNHVIDRILAEHVEYNGISFPDPNSPLDLKNIDLDEIIKSCINKDQEEYDNFYAKNKWSKDNDFYLNMLLNSAEMKDWASEENPMKEWALAVKNKYEKAKNMIEENANTGATSIKFNFFLDYIGLEALNKAAKAWLNNNNWYSGVNTENQGVRNYIEINNGIDYFLIDLLLNNKRLDELSEAAAALPSNKT